MNNDEFIFFIDDDLHIKVKEPLVTQTFESLKNKSDATVLIFSTFDEAFAKGLELKNKVGYCVFDPTLEDGAALSKDYLIELTLFRINSLVKFVNSEMKIVILTSLNSIYGEKLRKMLETEGLPAFSGLLFKQRFCTHELLAEELSNEILKLFLNA